MNDEINVVLIDKDQTYLQKLKSYLERKGKISVKGLTDDGVKGLEYIKTNKIDIILIDILLANKDGFWLLEQLEKNRINAVVIVMSAMNGDSIVRRTMTLGVDYFMAKPIQGDLLIERMYQLIGFDNNFEKEQSIRNNYLDNDIYNSIIESSNKKEFHKEDLELRITRDLNRMGVSAGIRGFHYIRCAIIKVIEEPEMINAVTKCLYPEVGREYKSTSSRVERAIRHAISSSWEKNGCEVYREMLGCEPSKRPTNSQFIATLADYFSRNTMKIA